MPDSITIDDTHIPLRIRKSTRARRIGIRILEKERLLELVIPHRMSVTTGLAFLEQRRPWVANHLHLFSSTIAFEEGVVISLFGEQLTVSATDAKRGVWQEGGILYVSGQKEHIARRVEDYIKKCMRHYCAEQALVYAKALEVQRRCKRVAIRNTSTRWGSCSHRGTLSFCWRLALAPKDVLDYVIVHEVAHLREMNHSSRFWLLVHHLMPTFELHRQWLKKHGMQLWHYG